MHDREGYSLWNHLYIRTQDDLHFTRVDKE